MPANRRVLRWDRASGPLAVGNGGVLYGATASGGHNGVFDTSNGGGVVFSLTPPATTGGNWTETVLYSFLGTVNPDSGGPDDGTHPLGVAIGSGDVLYGTTSDGGNGRCIDAATPPMKLVAALCSR